MKTPSTLAILMAAIVGMAHRERIVLKCNSVTDAEFQDSVSMEIYCTVQHERTDKRKNLRITFVNDEGKTVPSSKMFNKFSTYLDERFVIAEIFNKISEEPLEVPAPVEVPANKVADEIDENPIFDAPIFEGKTTEVPEPVENSAEILSSIGSEIPEEPKNTKKGKKSTKVVDTPAE